MTLRGNHFGIGIAAVFAGVGGNAVACAGGGGCDLGFVLGIVAGVAGAGGGFHMGGDGLAEYAPAVFRIVHIDISGTADLLADVVAFHFVLIHRVFLAPFQEQIGACDDIGQITFLPTGINVEKRSCHVALDGIQRLIKCRRVIACDFPGAGIDRLVGAAGHFAVRKAAAGGVRLVVCRTKMEDVAACGAGACGKGSLALGPDVLTVPGGNRGVGIEAVDAGGAAVVGIGVFEGCFQIIVGGTVPAADHALTELGFQCGAGQL